MTDALLPADTVPMLIEAAGPTSPVGPLRPASETGSGMSNPPKLKTRSVPSRRTPPGAILVMPVAGCPGWRPTSIRLIVVSELGAWKVNPVIMPVTPLNFTAVKLTW